MEKFIALVDRMRAAQKRLYAAAELQQPGLEAEVDRLLAEFRDVDWRKTNHHGEMPPNNAALVRWLYAQMQEIEPSGCDPRNMDARVWDCIPDCPEKAAVLKLCEGK